MKKNIEKFRGRNLLLVLYPDEDETHKDALEILDREFEVAYIKHDQDLQNEDEEELKKPHVHVVLHTDNAIWNTALAKSLGITENYIRLCNDQNKSLKYLIHFDNPEKYQYSFEEVKGSKRLRDKLWALMVKADKTPEELGNEILDFINYYGGVLSTKDFLSWIFANGLSSALKSHSGWFRDVLKEHNDKEFRKQKSSYGELTIFRNGKELTTEEKNTLFSES